MFVRVRIEIFIFLRPVIHCYLIPSYLTCLLHAMHISLVSLDPSRPMTHGYSAHGLCARAIILILAPLTLRESGNTFCSSLLTDHLSFLLTFPIVPFLAYASMLTR